MKLIDWDYGEAYTDGEAVRFEVGTKSLLDLWGTVDLKDWPDICTVRWSAKKQGRLIYIASSSSAERYLHRAIMKPGHGLVVDHIDGNGLNNCRSNLRLCTLAQNFEYGRERKFGESYADRVLNRWVKKRARRQPL